MTTSAPSSIYHSELFAAVETGDVDKVRECLSICGVNCTDAIGWTALHHACHNGKVNLVRMLVSELGADITIRTLHGWMPIHVAALAGEEEVAMALIGEFGCSADVKGRSGSSVLHSACKGGNVSLLQTLVHDFKADLNAQDNYADTPLHVAVSAGLNNVAMALMELGCSTNIKDQSGRSVLHVACTRNNISLLQTLVHDYKADLNAQDYCGLSPLHVAVSEGKDEAAMALMELGCSTNVKDLSGASVLHHACKGGQVSLVQTLIHDYMADPNAQTRNKCTPLHVAVSASKDEVAMTLMELGCSTNVKEKCGRSVLHLACLRNNVSLAQILIRDYKADLNAQDESNDTPLHMAVLAGNEEIAMVLLKFGCDINKKGFSGKSVLHIACERGYVSLVQTLIHDYKADLNAQNNRAETPLHVAASEGKDELAMALMELGCSTNVKGEYGRSILHIACLRNNVSLVQMLIRDYKADLNAQNMSNDTPLHVAVSAGNEEIAMVLLKFGCQINTKGYRGKSVLHIACEKGYVSLVRTLVCDYRADMNAQDTSKSTPLHVAVYESEVAIALLELGCSTNVKGEHGSSVLHIACKRGDVGLVQTMVRKYGADLNAQDDSNNTPLHVVVSDKLEVAIALMELGCSTNVKGQNGISVLHLACKRGDVHLVQAMVREYGADLNAHDDSNDTPLHVAVSAGKEEVAMLLIRLGCKTEVRNSSGQSVLHSACKSGCTEVVRLLSKSISLLVVDRYGDTPLHKCSRSGHIGCVEALLLEINHPVFVRNKYGMSAMDVATPEVKIFLDKYTEENKEKIFSIYKTLHICAKEKYSRAEPITRIFVLGNPGAGKSSLIASLKKEGFFESFWRVTPNSVPLHTAGIIPSTFESRYYGRVLFYDFAGDSEYYSSHAAIFENIAPSNIGHNIFIFVTDMTEGVQKTGTTLGYWYSFIRHQKFDGKMSSLIIVGSHLDRVSSTAGIEETVRSFLEKIQPNHFLYKKSFFLDCCQPKSQRIKDVRSYISTLIRDSPHHRLSLPATVLLGLLGRDFSMVAACSVEKITSHIEETGVPLPQITASLLPILQELHDIGLLFLVRGSSRTTSQVVLNISQLTNEVHQLLFSGGLQQRFPGSSPCLKVGILDQCYLDKILPEHITKDCLIYLQYCQEISQRDVRVLAPHSQTDSTSQSLLFFPALCCLSKEEISWDSPSDYNYSIGWLAKIKSSCSNDYFSSRFLHVLLLRLAYKFALPAARSSSSKDHRCFIWKTGAVWLTVKGVECMVELPTLQDNKMAVVVITRSEKKTAERCLELFTSIISCVMEAKAEFCHSVEADFFLIHSTVAANLINSTEAANFLTEDNLFEMDEVKMVLDSLEESVISVSGKKQMPRDQILCLHKFTYWYSLFPLDVEQVSRQLQKIVPVSAGDMYSLGLHLDLPTSDLTSIEQDFTTTESRRRELVRRWLSSSRGPPCWWLLVQALKTIDANVLAESIEKEHSVLIQLQRSLLSQDNNNLKPDDQFLELFASVVDTKWPSLTSILSLTSMSTEMRKEEDTLSHQDCALLILKKWVLQGNATYGQLRQRLKTIVFFSILSQ